MEKIIKIDLKDEKDLIEKYNDKYIAKGMIEYIIKQAKLIKKKDKIKIVINKKCNIDKNITEFVKDGLKEEYKISLLERHRNNVKQLIFLGLGSIFIFLSTLIKNESMWREILLIIGWVPIWEMIEVELFPDVIGRRKRRIIKKLLESEIIVEKVEIKKEE